MAQIIPVVSDALQATIRRLLPSQNGFGEDLQAQNVIVPIIDLTPTAEGSSVPSYLTNALSFGSQTYFQVSGASQNLGATTGFWQVTYVSTLTYTTGAVENQFKITNGLSTKNIWEHRAGPASTNIASNAIGSTLIVFLDAGDTLSARSSSVVTTLSGSYRQIADANGNLVNPVGFNPQ